MTSYLHKQCLGPQCILPDSSILRNQEPYHDTWKEIYTCTYYTMIQLKIGWRINVEMSSSEMEINIRPQPFLALIPSSVNGSGTRIQS